jgi:uncharacterized membrane protein
MLHILLAAHLLLFVFSFAFTAGLGILQSRVARSGDARKIHTVFSACQPLSLAGGIGWLLTALVGAGLAQMAGYSLTDPWLLYSYAGFVVLIAVGFGIHRPFQARVAAASANGMTPELEAILKSPVEKVAAAVSALAIIAIVWLMSSRMA